jgi:hypothetical protein
LSLIFHRDDYGEFVVFFHPGGGGRKA